MMQSKKSFLFFIFLLLVTILPSAVNAAIDVDDAVCIGGMTYKITNMGSKVTNIWDITTSNMKYKSMLPAEYFEMKEYIKKNNINLNIKLDEADKSSLDYRKYMIFMLKYGTTYNKYGVNQPEKDYAFEATFLGIKCTRGKDANGKDKLLNCPTSKNIIDGYNSKSIEASVSKFKFDESRKQFYLDINDSFKIEENGKQANKSFNGNVMVRVVRDGKDNLEEYEYNSLNFINTCSFANCVKGRSDEIYSIPKGGSVRIYFGADANVSLEFYLKDDYAGDCKSSYFGYFRTTAPDSIDVTNPWLNDAICVNFKNNKDINGNIVKSYENIPSDVKELMVSECYRETVDYFKDIANSTKITRQKIQASIDETAAIYSVERVGTDLEKGLQCHYKPDGSWEGATETKTFNYDPVNAKYWTASCYEKTEVTYDQPKKVIAGAGFPYEAVVTVTRVCKPIPIKVKLPSKCSYAVECYGGPAHHSGESGAGPNEDFESCISACDGGQYTQDCINQCYSNVYEQKDEQQTSKMAFTSFLDVVTSRLNGNNSNAKVTFLASIDIDCSKYKNNQAQIPNYCYNNGTYSYSKEEKNKQVSNRGRYIANTAATSNKQTNCNGSTSCTSKHGITFTYLNGCNSDTNPTVCYEVYRNNGISKLTTPYCSDNPSEDVKIEEQIARDEYFALLEGLKNYETNEEFTMKIVDSYKKENGKLLTTTFTGNAKDTENSLIKIEGGVKEYEDGKKYKVVNNRVVAYSEKGTTIEVSDIEVKKTYKISLPQAYVDQLTGLERYVAPYETRTKADSERDGGNKYYTDLNSGTYNDFRKWGTDGTYYPKNNEKNRTGNNIKVIFSNVGTEQTSNKYTWASIPIDCFYGLLNQRYIKCEDDICEELTCDPDKDICTGGLQYYFRQVNLSDLFPQRDPRWNWTKYASVYDSGYAVDPSEEIEKIEAKGNNAYTEEPDYVINLTGKDIKKIRSKNNSLNYQQYFDGMDCDRVNGMEVCKSNIDSYVESITRNTVLGENE